MSGRQYAIPIVDGSTGGLIEAFLFDSIEERHLRDFEQHWRPWLERVMAENPGLPRQESAHWGWRAKVEAIQGLLGYPCFAVECANQTQGLMIVNTMKSCRIESQKGKSLVYIEYLETAPWNRANSTAHPRFKRVGPALLDVAIQLSRHEGFDGRIGLHSLPQSEPWYRDICGMTDLGRDPDPSKQNLRYFEMTTEQSSAFVWKGD